MTNGFTLIGISQRTTNKDNRSMEDLGKLWARFYAENVWEKIPNKCSNKIIVVYTDYKSDFSDEYTVIIGVPVSTLAEIPNGFVGLSCKPGHFKKFVAKGEMPNAVVNTWREIWQRDRELNRKYDYDFEVYERNPQNGEEPEVAIYIGIKD